jgi:hypothetical protein
MTLKEMDLLISKKIQCSSSPDPIQMDHQKKCVAFAYKQMITASDREAFTGCKYHAFIWRDNPHQHQSPI